MNFYNKDYLDNQGLTRHKKNITVKDLKDFLNQTDAIDDYVIESGGEYLLTNFYYLFPESKVIDFDTQY